MHKRWLRPSFTQVHFVIVRIVLGRLIKRVVVDIVAIFDIQKN